KCGEPCEELALECAELECNYLVHWKCVKPYGSVYLCPLFILLGEAKMEGSNNYGHQHPLLLILNEDRLLNVAKCSRCREKVSTPCFSCAEDCGFYLHKVCAEAPLELNHPFHPDHPLLLMQNAPYSGGYICNFCRKGGNEFVYHCSCNFDFHIKCALFTFNIAENNLKELEHVALQDE
ncbi:hypothetical protein Gotur_006665, partial [Gossypium turneri]